MMMLLLLALVNATEKVSWFVNNERTHWHRIPEKDSKNMEQQYQALVNDNFSDYNDQLNQIFLISAKNQLFQINFATKKQKFFNTSQESIDIETDNRGEWYFKENNQWQRFTQEAENQIEESHQVFDKDTRPHFFFYEAVIHGIERKFRINLKTMIQQRVDDHDLWRRVRRQNEDRLVESISTHTGPVAIFSQFIDQQDMRSLQLTNKALNNVICVDAGPITLQIPCQIGGHCLGFPQGDYLKKLQAELNFYGQPKKKMKAFYVRSHQFPSNDNCILVEFDGLDFVEGKEFFKTITGGKYVQNLIDTDTKNPEQTEYKTLKFNKVLSFKLVDTERKQKQLKN